MAEIKAPRSPLAGRNLEFFEPDMDAFPALRLAFEAGAAGGAAPCVFNAADEVAVAAFLAGRLSFLGIAEVIESTLERASSRLVRSIEELKAIDAEARALAEGFVRDSP